MAAGAEPQNQEWQLVDYVAGVPTPASFALVDIELRAPEDGEVVVKTTDISVDPYMRSRMRPGATYVPSFEPGKAMSGDLVGVVTESRSDALKVGDFVKGYLPWRRFHTVSAATLTKLDVSGVKPSVYLGVLGLTGLSAYFPCIDIAEAHAGDVAFVSGAAGAVGSVAGQVLKLLGCRVIGSAGSDEKVAFLRDVLKFDGAFNYRKESTAEALRAFSPAGYDIYWDNVGGETLDTVLLQMKDEGRVVACGAISDYNVASPSDRYGLRNTFTIVTKQLKVQGFLLRRWRARFAEGVAQLKAWLDEGKLVGEETVVEGMEKLPEGFIGLFHGTNTGKMVIHVADA